MNKYSKYIVWDITHDNAGKTIKVFYLVCSSVRMNVNIWTRKVTNINFYITTAVPKYMVLF